MTSPSVQPGLGTKAAKGVLWIGGGQLLRQGIQILSQLILVRLLVPDDFGVLGMAMLFVGVGQLFANFGIGSAVIQDRTSDNITLSSCFWLNVGVSLALGLVVLVASPWIAHFYKRSDLAPIVALLSLNLLLAGLQVMPTALLYRDMRFEDLSRAQVAGSLVGAAAAIGLAWWGAGVWSLVWQPLIGSTVTLAWIWIRTRWWPGLNFDWPRVRPLAVFSYALLGSNIVGYANRNVDNLLIGRFLGAGPLGIYTMAIQIMLFPLQQISSVIVRVLFPTLVQIKDDLPRLRAAYLKAIQAIAVLTFPLMFGLLVLADDFVPVVFGSAWLDMIPVLKILAMVGLMQSIGTTVGAIYLSVGRPQIALRVSLVALVVYAVGIGAGLPWGIVGVAIGYALACVALLYYTLISAFPLIDLTLGQFHASLIRPFAASAAMAAPLWWMASHLVDWPAAQRLACGIGLGALLYGLSSLALNRQQWQDLLRTLRSATR